MELVFPEGLQFLEPFLFWMGLAFVAVLAVAYAAAQHRRIKNAKRLTNFDLLEKAERGEGGRWRRHIPVALGLIGLLALSAAIAQPVTVERIPHERARIVLALDNSRSTNAVEQPGGPARIERIKAQALEIVDSAREGDELPLVVFADEAILSVEPTTDREALRQVITNLEPEVETDLGGALLEAHRLTRGTPVASHVIVLSDGAATTSTSVELAVERLQADNVSVSTNLIGSQGGFALVGGLRRPFPAQPEMMQRIAEKTGGHYVNGSVQELEEVYTNLERTVRYSREEEPVWLFLYAGFGLLVIASGTSFYRRKTLW